MSEWVDAAHVLFPQGRYNEFEDAIRNIGSNGLPYLLKWTRYETSPWKTLLYRSVNLTLGHLNRSCLLPDQKQLDRADGSSGALRILGPDASGVIRELTETMNDPNAHVSAHRAAHVLISFGGAAFSSLVSVLTNRQSKFLLKADIIATLGAVSNSQLFLPALQVVLNDSDAGLRQWATNTIRKIDSQALERATR